MAKLTFNVAPPRKSFHIPALGTVSAVTFNGSSVAYTYSSVTSTILLTNDLPSAGELVVTFDFSTVSDPLTASVSGKLVFTGTPTQGATALGLGTTNTPTFAGATLTGPLNAGASANVTTSGDAKLYLEDTGADSNSYRRKMLFASRNVGGGSDTLLRAQRPSDGATLDYVFVSAYPGHVITSAYLAGGLPGPVRLASYTVATVPAGSAGALIYVSNARKIGEASGNGTGVIANFSNGSWRRLSDDSVVAA